MTRALPVGVRTGDDRGGARSAVLPIAIKLLRVAKRWRWIILGAVGVMLLLGVVLTLLATPRYTATTTLEIQRESARIVNVEGVEPKASGIDMEFYQTQFGLLRSESLAERVARNLNLHNNPEFFEQFGAESTAAKVREGKAKSPAAVAERQRLAGQMLLGSIEISPARGSRLVDVSFTSPSPQLSARISNAWAQNFIETNLERRFDATAYARRFLEQRLEQLRQRLEESERLLVGYASEQGIVSVPTSTSSSGGQGGTSERPLIADNLSELNSALNAATASRIEAESRAGNSGASTAEALSSQAIATLRARRAELAADYAKILVQFEPQYPPALALASQIKQLDQSIAAEVGRVGSTLRSTYDAAVAREAALRERVDTLRGDLLDLRGRSIQYNIYQREVDTNRELYDGLLQRYKEIGVTAGVGVNNISVVDTAEVPTVPSSPNLFRNILLSLLIGLLIGGGLALGLEQIDEAVSDPDSVESDLGVPVLGTIPKSETKDLRADLSDPKSSIFEAYLSAQTSLAFTTDHGIPKSLMVTSTRPAEGKTTSSYAFSRSIARTGRRVIIVDADMRSPSLHHIFDQPNAAGFSNYLAGDDDLSKLILTDPEWGVAFMPAGPPPPNAAELLTGLRLPALIAKLSETYDNIIFDAPPVMGLADAPVIASATEGAIFVIESHQTRTTAARVAIRRLEDARARLVGVVLTKFEAKRATYGYGYDYGYSYNRET